MSAHPIGVDPDASEAHHGHISSRTRGAVQPRHASGGAAFSRWSCPDIVAARNAKIVWLADEGLSQGELAEKFGVSRVRICQILKREGATYERQIDRARAQAANARRSRLLSLYQAGYSQSEIARREGIHRSRVCEILLGHPDYIARNGSPRIGRGIPVPAWVPAEWHDTYRRLAAANGEEVAASCMRKRKRLEART